MFRSLSLERNWLMIYWIINCSFNNPLQSVYKYIVSKAVTRTLVQKHTVGMDHPGSWRYWASLQNEDPALSFGCSRFWRSQCQLLECQLLWRSQLSYSVKGKSRPGTRTECRKAVTQGWPSLSRFDTCYGVFLSSIGCSEPDPMQDEAGSGAAVPRAWGAQRSALLSWTTSARSLCHCWALFLLLSFPGDLKSNYKKRKKKLQVFVSLRVKSSFSLTPTFVTRIFLLSVLLWDDHF